MRAPAVFAPMLRERAVCIGLLGSGVVLVGMNLLGWPSWLCPFHEATGLPCPGCGLTRGMSALAHGDVKAAVVWHPFTPLFALAALHMLLALVLPATMRAKMIVAIEHLERSTGFVLITLFCLVVYGAWRWSSPSHWP